MMKLLKFIGSFVLVTLILLGLVVGLNWNSFQVFLDNRTAFFEGIELAPKITSLRGFSEFIAENGEYASLASVTIDNPENSIYLGESTPRAMGATANFFILAAYAYEFDQNMKAPSDKAAIELIKEYQIGGEIGQSISDDTFRAAHERGYIRNGEISLDNLLLILAEFNDLTVADFLWWNIEDETWQWMVESLDLSYSNMPLPYSGIYLSIAALSEPETIADKLQVYKQMDPEGWWNRVREVSYNYLHSESYRDSANTFLDKNRLGITFMDERDALTLFPSITAEKMTSLLKTLEEDLLVSEAGSAMIKQWMSWPMKLNQNYINDDFEEFRAIYDNRMGLLSGITLGTSAYTGKTFVQALYLDELPIGFWFHASSGHIHQDFMQRLIFDPAMDQQMRQSIRRSNNTNITATNE